LAKEADEKLKRVTKEAQSNNKKLEREVKDRELNDKRLEIAKMEA